MTTHYMMGVDGSPVVAHDLHGFLVWWLTEGNRRIKWDRLIDGSTLETVFMGVALGEPHDSTFFSTAYWSADGSEVAQILTRTRSEAIEAHCEFLQSLQSPFAIAHGATSHD